MPLVRVRAKKEKYTLRGWPLNRENKLCGRSYARVMAKLKKDALCGRPFVEVRAKIE